MTLGDFLKFCSDHPTIVVFYYASLSLTAFLSGTLGRGQGGLTPWKQLYTILIYSAAVPGIFAVTLSFYLLLFERQSILEWDVMTQILPVIFMVFVFWLVKRNVDLKDVPGFGRIEGLIAMILAMLALLWMLDRTRIFVVTIIPIQYVVLMLIGLLVVARVAWVKVFGSV